MTPLKRTLEIEETIKRFDDCVWYCTCLDKAAHKRLQSFACTDCENYIPTPGLQVENFLVQQDDAGPKPLGNMGNLKRNTKGLADKLRKKGIFMVGFRQFR